jgi:hypothetical protein
MISGTANGRFLSREEAKAEIRAANSSDRRKCKPKSDLRSQDCEAELDDAL